MSAANEPPVSYEIHPLADLVPRMTLAEYEELRESIAANGLRVPILLHEGKVLDGRHRLQACQDEGVWPTFTEYMGDEPAGEVLSLNLHRRNLDASQRAMLAVVFWPELQREARDKMAQGGAAAAPGRPAEERVGDAANPFHTRDRAAQKTGASGRSVASAKRVKDADPALAEKVLAGEIKVATAEREVIAREKAEQNGHAQQKPETGKRQPQAIVRIAERLDATLLALDEIAVQKSCDGLTQSERETAAEAFKKAATRFRSVANMLAATGKESA